MATSGMMKPLTGWQRANVLAAAEYLREVLQRSGADPRGRAVYEGLLEALDPTRRAVRLQREMAGAARAAIPVGERRVVVDRRRADRRQIDLGPPGGIERRKGQRRSGQDRRAR